MSRRVEDPDGPGRTGMIRPICAVLAAGLLSVGCGYPTVAAPWSRDDAPPGEYEPHGLPDLPVPSGDAGGPGATEPGVSDGVLDRIIVDAYTEAYRLAHEAYADPSIGGDGLSAGFAEPLLGRIEARVDDLAARGVTVHHPSGAPPTGQVLFTAAEGATATARVCVVDDGVEVDDATREAVAGTDSSTLRDIELVDDGGTWKVAEDVVVDEWPDLDGCRLAG